MRARRACAIRAHMMLARLLACTSALALTACATSGRVQEPTTPGSSYRLCADPAFESMCSPASLSTQPAPIRVDTNLATPPLPRPSHAV